jgi:hypothetical protein
LPVQADGVEAASFQPLTADDFDHAKGHVFPLLLVRLALRWVTGAHSSLRAVSLIFSSMRGIFFAKGPCAETIRLWLLRAGLHLLQRPLPPCRDWVYLLDLSIQLGQHKCLVVLGIPLSKFRKMGTPMTHQDVHVLSIKVLTSCTGEIVYQHLVELAKRTTQPVQVVSDHGSDVLCGVRLFQKDCQELIETYDITHGLALLLKGRLEPSTRWDEFVKNCQQVRAQVQQTAGSFLRPPAWRQKARYLNLEGHLKWAREMLLLLASKTDDVLGQQLGCDANEARAWLEEKVGWLRGFRKEVSLWSYFQDVVKGVEKRIKEKGLRRSSWRKIGQDQRPSTKEAREFVKEVRQFVRRECEKLPDNDAYVGSTDVLESMFGKYKDIAKHAPSKEITANVLMLPLFATPLTASLLREALDTVHEENLKIWIEQQLGLSPQKKKSAVMSAAHRSSEGQFLA